MSLKLTLHEDMKSALRAGEKERLGTIRMALAAIKTRELDEGELDDPQVHAVIEKMIKQRRESIVHYERGNRADLVDKETAEIGVLQGYLPEPLSESELEALIDEVVAATGAASIKDMARVMGQIKSRALGRADMGAASARVREKLSG